MHNYTIPFSVFHKPQDTNSQGEKILTNQHIKIIRFAD